MPTTMGELEILVEATGTDKAVQDLGRAQKKMGDTAKNAKNDTKALHQFSTKFGGAMAIIAASMATAIGALLTQMPIAQEIFGAMGYLVETLAYMLDDVLRPILEPLADAIYSLSEKFDELPGPVKTVIAYGLLFVGIVALLLAVIVPLVAAIAAGGIAILVVGGIIMMVAVTIAMIAAYVLAFYLLWKLVWWAIGPIVTKVIDVIWGAIEAFVDWFDRAFGDQIRQTIDEVMKTLKAWGRGAQAVFDLVLKGIKLLIGGFLLIWEPAWENAKKVFVGIWDVIGGVVTDIWKTIVTVVETGINAVFDIIQLVLALLRGDWESVWNYLKEFVFGIYEGIVAIWSGLGDVIKGALNIAIHAINAIIDSINDISVEVPDWVPGFGGKSFGFDITKIPTLQTGGMITRTGAAVVDRGEGVFGMDQLTNAMVNAFRISGLDNGRPVEVYLDSTKISRALDDRENQRAGAQGGTY